MSANAASTRDAAGHYALLLWTLSTLFALRVLGQAMQAWFPQEFLPPFDAFQGSTLPYSVLLPAQLLILGLMLYASRGVQQRTLIPTRRAGAILAWAGSAYMAFALARLAIGLTVAAAPAWFRTWIPGLWHVVLAAFVLTLAAYHLINAQRTRGRP